jgi:glucokinase
MAEEYLVGVDLGGTRVRVAMLRVEEVERPQPGHPPPLAAKVETVQREGPNDTVPRQIARLIRALLKERGLEEGQLRAIGIASAGPLSDDLSAIVHSPNLPWDCIPVVPVLREAFPRLKVALENDCNGAALGVQRFEAPPEMTDFVYVTLSTGIGGGAIVNGTLCRGRGNGAEIGHITIDSRPDALFCGCGKRGHWEAYGSGTAVAKRAHLALAGGEPPPLLREAVAAVGQLDAEAVFRAAAEGDWLCQQLVEDTARYNAIGFAALTDMFDPQKIFVGGSLTKSGDLTFRGFSGVHLRDRAALHALNDPPPIETTALGDDVGLYGGLVVAWEAMVGRR